MKLLFLTGDVPLPADRGSKLRSAGLIRAAAAHHQVDLLSFARERPPAEAEEELRRLCRQFRLVDAPSPRSGLYQAWSLLFGVLPYIARRLDAQPFRQALAETMEAETYDVVQIEGLEVIPFLPVARSLGGRAAIIYDAHRPEMAFQRTIFRVQFRYPNQWHAGLYSLLQWSKLGTYERIMMNEADMVLCASDLDADKLRGRRVDPEVVPNGVDTERIAYRSLAGGVGGQLLFVGPMDHPPNADAIRWFLTEVLPRVREWVPEARLRLAGRGTERVRAAGVQGLGYVEDLGPELAAADACVAPIRMGGSVRFKVLEAMAAGVPVVSTSMGLAGIAAQNERHALVADTPQEFAAAVVRALQDRVLVRRMVGLARLLVEGRYDWGKITPSYLRLLTVARRTARLARSS